ADSLGVHATGDTLTGEYDVVVDAVGTSITRSIAVKSIRPAGTALWLGLEDEGTDIDVRSLIRSERSVITSFCYTDADFAAALSIASRSDASWVDLVPLHSGVEAFTELMNGRTD